MRKKILISSLVLATIPAIAAVSCAPQNTETNEEKTIKELKAKLAKIKKENQTEKEQIQAQLDALRQRLETTNQQKDESDQTKTRLEQEIEELQEKINELEAKRVKRNDKSAKKFFEQISDFLAIDLPNAIKQQNPNSYNSNRDLLDGVTQSIEKSKEELKDTPEDFSNLWTWENAILFSLNRADIITKFIDDPQNPVTVNIPKLTEMDDLFDWRINDIDRIMSQIRTSDATDKEVLLAEFEGYKKEYQDAKTNSSLLTHQISNWQKLEKQGEGIASKFIDFSSTNYRSLLPKFNMPDFKISLFPVYRKIVDEEFKKQTKDKLAKLLANYKTLFSKSATDFITSVSYHKLHEKVKAELLKISAALVDDNLSYFNEFELWEDVDRFVYEANNTLLEGFFVDNKELKQQMDEEVSREFDVAVTNSFAKQFDNKYKNKADENRNDNQNEVDYLYKVFYNSYKTAMITIKNMEHDTYIKSFDRYQEYLTVKKQIQLSESLINLFKSLGDNLDNPELKELLKWNNSEKMDKLIDQTRQNKTNDEKLYNEQKSEIDKLIANYDGTSNAREFINTLFATSEEVLNNFTQNFNEDGDELGKWAYMYTTTPQILELLTKQKQKINDVKNNNELSEEQLKEKINEINAAALEIKSKMFEIESNGDNPLAYFVFNKAYFDFYQSKDEETYATKSKPLDDLEILFKYFKDYKKESKENEQVKADLETQLTSINNTLTTLEEAFYYDHAWYSIGDDYTDSGYALRELRDNLVTKLNEFKEKVESLKNSIESSTESSVIDNKLAELSTEATNLLTSLGNKNLGLPTLTNEYHVTQSERDTQIENYENRKRKIAKTAKLVPGQELFVLLRYWKDNKKADFEKILLQKDDYQDKELAKFLNDEKDSVSNNSRFNSIISVDSSTSSWSVSNAETDEKEQEEINKIYEQFKELETAYAETLIAWLNRTNDSNVDELKTNLKQKRSDYYTFLNGLKDKHVNLENKYIRFSADLYNTDKSEPTEYFVAATLLSFYAKIESTTEIMQNIYDTYIK
ncbi:hypothetical protein KQ875_03010 [Mycoplasma zalophi]|uniref:Lipoprotein n=1 Tax=Mycoplasma zalophi TaxID=191287 RepID=A0ABS6DS07_9MOLU|nr:hypothetical protein [Mycoplasma zalophi]MBU4692546.1 hypothetical protein [Mycoplasma zalophi]